jgi:transcriptional regulator with XRE-family HTH domain
VDNFGGRLRWVRQKANLTLDEFGERVGVGRSYISKLENGHRLNVSENFLRALCFDCFVNRDWILNGAGEPFTWDHLNETANKGYITFPPKPPENARKAAFFEALVPAGMAISASEKIEDLAQFMSHIPFFHEDSRVEFIHILTEELNARISWRNEHPNDSSVFTGAISQVGKLAVLSIRYQAEGRSKIPIVNETRKTDLTNIVLSDNIQSVKAQLPELQKRLNEATRKRGTKTALAKFMGVKLPTVSRWLSGEKEPGGETTLRLLHWVEQQERPK